MKSNKHTNTSEIRILSIRLLAGGRYNESISSATAGIVVDGELIMSYGAADQKVGVAWVNFGELVEHIRSFDAEGRKPGQF